MAKKVKIAGVEIDPRNLKPYVRDRKVKDPPRFPNVILGYEGEMNKAFDSSMNDLVRDLVKVMVELKK